MGIDYRFYMTNIQSLVGGLTALDIPKLNIQNLEEAISFIKAYGFDVQNEDDLKRLWNYHRRAVTFIQTELLNEGEEFPEAISDPNQLKDISYLLIYASTQDQRETSLQRWACATLKVMHVLVHLDNDLFTHYSTQIQDQIFKPYQNMIYKDPASGIFLGGPNDFERISLHKFDVKPFKTSKSSVTKLLSKPEEVAFSLLDKMGVRFVTRHLFDTFRVLRFLIQKNLVSFPHVISDQSNNTLYPINLFFEVLEGVTKEMDLSPAELDVLMMEKIKKAENRAEFRQKLNVFSSKDYKFMKFITRSLVRIPMTDDKKTFSFFYPYEVQIVDYETYLKNLSGPASHDEYKLRQKQKARLRVLGFSPST
ncbi:MAG: TIGR04552 family protein [Bdellovibrionales bacterium]|nr:TIGR04552 family protein [Bdellovibrionales bacterium]